MCFNIAQSKKLKDLAKRYGIKTNVVEMAEEILKEKRQQEDEKRAKSIAIEQYFLPAYLKPECPIITNDGQIRFMRWGLIPANAKLSDLQKIDKGNWFINARSENIFETYPYKMSITNHRCIIPVTGFFEPHYDTPKGKSWMYYIHLQNQEIFSIGGVFSHWNNPENGQTVESFSMLTTQANPLMYQTHNGGKHPHRMPLILNPENEMKWIDQTINRSEIEKLIKVFPDNDMVTYPLRNDYQKYDFSDKLLIENTNNRTQKNPVLSNNSDILQFTLNYS